MQLWTLSQAILDTKVETPTSLGNGGKWDAGFEAGVHSAKKEMAMTALRASQYISKLESLIKSQQTELSGFSGGYLKPEGLQGKLLEMREEAGL